MKIRSEIHAGYTSVEQCQADAQYWKDNANAMETFAKTGTWPSGMPYPYVPTTLPAYPTTPTYPPSSSGGYVQGVWYADLSGACG